MATEVDFWFSLAGQGLAKLIVAGFSQQSALTTTTEAGGR